MQLVRITEGSKTIFCSSKSPRERERISSKCIDSLGTRPQEGSPALTYTDYSCITITDKRMPFFH